MFILKMMKSFELDKVRCNLDFEKIYFWDFFFSVWYLILARFLFCPCGFSLFFLFFVNDAEMTSERETTPVG